MKIAILWNHTQPLVSTTVRHDLYARGLGRRGHDVVTVCLAAAAAGVQGRVVTFDDPREPTRPELWTRVRPDVLLAVTWLSVTDELVAAAAAGARVVALADSDGQVGFGTHRRHVLYRSVMQHARLRDRIAATKFFGQRLLNRQAESATTLRSIAASHVVLVNTAVAAENVRAFLRDEGRADLVDRIGVCPYPVDQSFVEAPVAGRTTERVVAVGRWESMQKDAALLRDGLAAYYAAGGSAEAHLFGSGGDVFASLAAHHPQVKLRGVVPPAVVAETMRTSQILLLTSRWESGPIVAFEALCLGCSLVATDIPNLRELVAGGAFGRVVSRRSPSEVASALGAEFGRWRAGHRDPAAIAAQCRPVFSAEGVCSRVLDALVEPADRLFHDTVLAGRARA